MIDYYFLYLYYDNLRVILRSSYIAFENSMKYVVHGTGGTFIKHGEDPQEKDLTNGMFPGGSQWGEEPSENYGTLYTPGVSKKVQSIPGNYLHFYDNVYDHLLHGAELEVKPEEVMQVMAIIEQAGRSFSEKKVVQASWNPGATT